MSSASTHPVVDRYLASLGSHLADLPRDDRNEVLREIGEHAAEALRAGRDPSDILSSLGDPARLADAYRIELAYERPRDVRGRVTRTFKVAGLLAASSFATFIVVILLGSFALVGLIGGPVTAAAGILSVLLPGSYIESSLPIPHSVAEMLAVLFGGALLLLGALAAGLLYLYCRTMIPTVRRGVARLRAAPAQPAG